MLCTSTLVFSPPETMYYFFNRVVFGTNKIKYCSKLMSRNLDVDIGSLAMRTLVDKEESLDHPFTSQIYSLNSSYSLGLNVKNQIACP